MPAFSVSFTHSGGREVHTWTRYAPNIETARHQAEATLDREYAGDWTLVDVSEIPAQPQPGLPVHHITLPVTFFSRLDTEFGLLVCTGDTRRLPSFTPVAIAQVNDRGTRTLVFAEGWWAWCDSSDVQ